MNKETGWVLASCLLCALAWATPEPSAGETPGRLSPDFRQHLLDLLASEIGSDPFPERWTQASVLVNGDVAVVRLPPVATSASGAVYVFEREAGAPGSDDSWGLETKLVMADEDHFADSVLLGDDTVMVAAPDSLGGGFSGGAAYAFRREAGGPWEVAAAFSADRPAAPAPAPTPAPQPATADEGYRFIVAGTMRDRQRAEVLSSDLRAGGFPSEIYLTEAGSYLVTLDRLPSREARRQLKEAVATGVIPSDAYLIVGRTLERRVSP